MSSGPVAHLQEALSAHALAATLGAVEGRVVQKADGALLQLPTTHAQMMSGTISKKMSRCILMGMHDPWSCWAMRGSNMMS